MYMATQLLTIHRRNCQLGILWLLAAAAPCLAQPSQLPQGNAGIAAGYPQDLGIERDQQVVWVERFDGGDLKQVLSRWESVADESNLRLVQDSPTSRPRDHCLQMTHVGGRGTGAHLYRRLEPGYEQLFYRFYVKFDVDCGPIHHFFHVGGYHPATPWPQGGAGQRPAGNERFSTGVEPFGDKWRWDFYSYWMEMRGSPPRGQCWGNSFLHDQKYSVAKGQWICVELMMKLNHPKRRDGEMALWIDGQLARHLGPGFPEGTWIFDRFVTDLGGVGRQWDDALGRPVDLPESEAGRPFPGFRWRNQPELKLNFLWLLFYLTKSPPGHVSRVWFDNIVVAKSYIGPLTPIDP